MSRRLFPARLLALSAVLLAAGARATRAQGVLVAPQGVFIDDRVRSSQVELYNPGNDAVDVSIGTAFGYPQSDSAGRTILPLLDHDTTGRSAAAWIEAFPRRLTLQAHQRQTVRLLARPPQGLPAGEYWARLVIAAKGGRIPVANMGGDTVAIQVGLNLEVHTVIAALYRKGAVQTGVAVTDLRTAATGDSLEARVHIARQGTAAYIGKVHATLLDAAGREASSYVQDVAVYYALDPVYRLPIAGLPAGRYTLRLEMRTDRDDVAREALLASPPVRVTADVVIPPPAGAGAR